MKNLENMENDICREEELDVCQRESTDDVINLDEIEIKFEDIKSTPNIEARKRFDSLWKLLSEVLISEFIMFFMPELEKDYDISDIRFLDTEMERIIVNPTSRNLRRHADKLIRLNCKDEKKGASILHVEFQGWSDPVFTRRMLMYYILSTEKHRLPYMGLALYTGKAKKTPKRFNSVFRRKKTIHDFHTYRIIDQVDENLKTSNNPFALVVLAAKIELNARQLQPAFMMDEFEWIYKKLFALKLSSKKEDAINLFLQDCVSISLGNKENYNIFVERIYLTTGKTHFMEIKDFFREEGRIEGLEQGRKETKETVEKIISNLLSANQHSPAQIARLLKLDPSFVNKVCSEFLVS